MDTVIPAPSRWAVQIAARLTKDQHRTKPVDLPAGCRQCGPCGCPLLDWARRVLAGEWPPYPDVHLTVVLGQPSMEA